jgi:hypothetical protein
MKSPNGTMIRLTQSGKRGLLPGSIGKVFQQSVVYTDGEKVRARFSDYGNPVPAQFADGDRSHEWITKHRAKPDAWINEPKDPGVNP